MVARQQQQLVPVGQLCLFALERDGVEEGHGRAGQE